RGRIAGAAEALDRMVAPGERVALLCTNSYQYVWASLAIELIGAVRVPVNIKSSQAEIGKIIADCAPVLILHEDATRDLVPGDCAARRVHVDDIALGTDADADRFRSRVKPEDICSINYTS